MASAARRAGSGPGAAFRRDQGDRSTRARRQTRAGTRAARKATLCAGDQLIDFPSLKKSVDGVNEFRAGVAREDITPAGPIRLTGYAGRKSESDGVAQRLWAKALSISAENDQPVILITADNCGICAPISEEVARRLGEKAGLARERLVICSSHTHSAPMARGFAPNIFAADVPADHQERIDRYSDRLIDLSLGQGMGVAGKTIANLATAELRDIKDKTGKLVEKGNGLDPYTRAHLAECNLRASKALEASYTYNSARGGGGFPGFMMFGAAPEAPAATNAIESDGR